MPEKKKRKSASLGCLFWIAVILLILVLFFFNKANIRKVLESTNAIGLFRKTDGADGDVGPKAPKIPEITTEPDADGDGQADSSATGTGDAGAEPGPTRTTAVETKTEPSAKPAATTDKPAKVIPKEPAKGVEPAKSSEAKKPAEKPAEKTAATRKATLFFVTIDPDGRVLRKEIARELPQTDAPLSDTLKALFRGTSSGEANKGLRSLIPEGTRLLSATVKGGVATVNVSEEFQFNQFGIEGYIGQLAQVVFTATAFPTVTSVQFLIEGQRREYLGAEGVWIGTPLDRGKF